MADLKTSIRIEADDRFSGPAKKIVAAGEKLGKHFEGLSRRAGRIDQYGKLTAAIGKTGSEMRRAQERTAELGRRLAATAEPSKKLRAEFEKARKISDRLGEKHREQRDRLRSLRGELRGAGIDTRKLSDAQRKLAADLDRTAGRIERIGQVQERADRAGQFALRASLVGGEVSRIGASMRRFASAPVEAAAEVGRQRGRLATLSMSEPGIDEVERVGRGIGARLAGVNLAGFIGAAYDVRSAMSDLSEVDVARVTGVAAELGRAADASTEEMTSAISGAYGVFKRPLFEQLSDIEFVEKYTSQLSQSVEQFRTTGGRMERAISTMGAGLSLGGIEMSEQLAALGQLQSQLKSGEEAGTALKSYKEGSVDAQEAFDKAGHDIQVIDKATGKLLPIASVLDDMERVFGAEYDARKGTLIKEAFGREEALRVIEGLWGGGKSLRAAAAKLEDATMADVRRRARARDENAGGALDRMRQRWENFQSKHGQQLESWLETLEWGFGKLLDIADAINERWPTASKWVLGGVGAFGLLAAPLSGIVISAGAAVWALRQIQLKLLEIGAMGGGPGMFGGPGGGLRGAGRRAAAGAKGLPAKLKGLGARGLAGRALGALKGKAGLLGAGIAALSIGSTLAGEASAGEKAARVSGDVGAIGGALAGGKLGALLGSAVFPGVGTLVGGALGSILGGIAGNFGGGKIGSFFGNAAPPEGLTPALAGAEAAPLGGLTAAGSGNVDNSLHIQQLTFQQQPGEDADAYAERVMRKIEQYQRTRSRGALHDEL